MKWLKLSTDSFEPIPEIQFSLKKPLFAASVVLRFTQTQGHGAEPRGEVLAYTALEARVPIKGLMHYTVEALSARAGRNFGFSFVREGDVTGGTARETHVRGVARELPAESETSPAPAEPAPRSKKPQVEAVAAPEDEWLEIDGAKLEVKNNSPVPILAHVLALPAFAQTHSKDEAVYAAHLMVGRRVQALRLERKSPVANGLETYEGKLMTVGGALTEKEFTALPWDRRKGFEFDWNAETKQLVAARFTVPIFGTIEIKH